MIKLFPLLLLPLLLADSCKKNVDELSKLPSATQEGKRIFGCLVNGKAWIPENGGLILTSPPVRFYYDNLNGGEFSIIAEKKISASNIEQYIVISIQNCSSTGLFVYQTGGNSYVSFAYNDYKNTQTSCVTLFSRDSTVQTTGQINITHFDLSQGIISGTFEFTLFKTGCVPITVTDGRFDAKL